MNSRMEKYYKDEDLPKRSVKNQSLYESIYEDNDYQEINVSPKERTIDINELRKMIHDTPKRVERRKIESVPSDDESESYDLNDAIERARSNKVIDDKKRSISNTQYDILKNIKLRDSNTTSLDEMLDTISTKNLANQDLDLFDNLKSLDDTTVGVPTNYDLETNEKKTQIDDSFFTKSMKLDPSDFESINSGLEQNNKMMKIIFILILVLIAIVLGIIIILVV